MKPNKVKVICAFCGIERMKCPSQAGKFCSQRCSSLSNGAARTLKLAQTFATRFWACVEKTNTCWLWKGFSERYGKFHIPGKRTQGYAHRIAYSLTYGEIPDGLLVCHSCDNTICVKPAHLFLGTQQDNIDDAVSKGRMHLGDAHGLRKHPELIKRGEAKPGAKLTEDAIRQIRAIGGTVSNSKIAREFKVSESLVHRIVRRKIWKHVL